MVWNRISEQNASKSSPAPAWQIPQVYEGGFMQVVRINGGLGNQMFQYAFGEYLKIINQDDVYCDLTDYDHHKHHQGFELENVFSGVDVRRLSDQELNKIRVNRDALVPKAVSKLFRVQLRKPAEFCEYPASLVVQRSKSGAVIYYDGYWGRKEYIQTAADAIRKAFVFRYEPEGKNRELLELIRSRGNTVSVHIRRGDYLQHENLVSVCDREYYRKAIQFFLDRDPETTFIFFSDDIPWVKEQFSSAIKNAVYVDWNTGTDSCRDMQMMSLCKNNIIANSTFSWWAAWLNENPEKQIVSPKMWSSSSKTGNYFENWYLI